MILNIFFLIVKLLDLIMSCKYSRLCYSASWDKDDKNCLLLKIAISQKVWLVGHIIQLNDWLLTNTNKAIYIFAVLVFNTC